MIRFGICLLQIRSPFISTDAIVPSRFVHDIISICIFLDALIIFILPMPVSFSVLMPVFIQMPVASARRESVVMVRGANTACYPFSSAALASVGMIATPTSIGKTALAASIRTPTPYAAVAAAPLLHGGPRGVASTGLEFLIHRFARPIQQTS